MSLVLLKLVTVHFVVWGLLERPGWLPDKTRLQTGPRSILYSALMFLILSSGLIIPTLHSEGVVLSLGLALIGLGAVVRAVCSGLSSWLLKPSWLSLILLHVLQIIAFCCIASWITGYDEPWTAAILAWSSQRTYVLILTYAISLGLGGALVRLITAALPGASERSDVGLAGAGSLIGLLERLLVTSFVLFWPKLDATAIGLIFSAKSIARFPEMGRKDGTHFAEYYLVGTLSSFAVAIAAGLVARLYLRG